MQKNKSIEKCFWKKADDEWSWRFPKANNMDLF